MSTNFLDRRMDLTHTIEGTSNILSMDTSYPVRLAGKVIKIFSACNDFSSANKTWIVRNTDKQTILSASAGKIFDFGNRSIYDSIGTEKYYPNEKSVYVTGQYILTIIDFDNSTIRLCSFANFVNTTDYRLSNSRPASDVYDWAKQKVKPTYTYQEVGALPASTVIGNGKLTIQNRGNTVATFTANSTTDVTANIAIDASKVEKSSTNGNVKIDGKETNVYTHPAGTNPHGTTKQDVGLGNVGNFLAVSTVSGQGLSEDQKAAARENIGAGSNEFSGSYPDLGNKPKINGVELLGNKSISELGVNDGTLIMNVTNSKGTKTTKTFSANASANTTVDIAMPTKTSDLTNDNLISGVKMNGSNITPDGNKIIDLGTVITDVSNVSKVEVFDVTGSTPMVSHEYNIDTTKFDEAVTFESKTGKSALVKNDKDKVLYQEPTKSSDSSERDMIPVAKVSNQNINAFNSSSYPLLFPNISTGYNESFETVKGIRNFVQLSGKVNDNFINKYCYTADEIKALPMINYNADTHTISVTSIGSKYLIYFIKDIFDNRNEDDYIYYIEEKHVPEYDESGKHVYGSSKKGNGLHILPISKSNYKFSAIDPEGLEFMCNGKVAELNFINISYGLPMQSKYYASIVGNWWGSNFTDKAKNAGSNTWTIVSATYTGAGTSDNPLIYSPFSSKVKFSDISMTTYNLSEYGEYGYLYDLGRCAAEIANKTQPSNKNFIVTTKATRDLFINMNKYTKFVDKMIYHYGNDDSYTNYTYDRLVTNANNSYMGNFEADYDTIIYNEDHTTGNKNIIIREKSCPTSVVGVCPESQFNTLKASYFDNNVNPTRLRDSSTSMSQTVRNGYKFHSAINENYTETSELTHLIYKMMSYDVDTLNDDNNKLNYITNNHSNGSVRMLGSDKAKCMITQDFLGDSSKYNTYIFDRYTSFSDLYVTHHFGRFMPRCIDEKDNKLATDIGLSRAVIRTKNKVQFAKKCIMFRNNSNDEDIIYTDTSNNSYSLYKVESSGDTSTYIKATFNNIKNIISKYGYIYLYYSNSLNTAYYRVKIVLNRNGMSGRIGGGCTTVFSDYCYVVYSGIVSRKITDTSSTGSFATYDFAYCAARSANASQVNTATPEERVKFVHNIYKLYPETGIIGNLVNGVAMPVIKSSSVGEYDTATLTVGIDYYICRYRNGGKINDKAYMMSDMLPKGTVVYIDGPAPMLSKTISDDGKSFIHSLEAYQDFISNVFVTQYTENIKSNVTSLTGGTVEPLLNVNQLRYANGVGVREEYYVNRTINDFFSDAITYDLSKPKAEQEAKRSEIYHVIYNKGTFDSITSVDSLDNYRNADYQLVKAYCDIAIHNSISRDNKFGFNKSEVLDYSKTEVSKDYISSEVIYVNDEVTGLNKVMSVSLTDEEGVMLNINGILGTVYCDNITWNDLLTALSNNKSIDVLSSSLGDMKSTVNKDIINAAQNINSNVSVADNVKPAASIAEYDTKTDLYSYNEFEGYKGGYTENATRNINNRGVLVFETDDGYTVLHRNGDSLNDRTRWTEDLVKPNLYAKRMYVSPEGLVCTKSYYDNATTTQTARTVIPDDITLQSLFKKIEDLEARIAELENK